MESRSVTEHQQWGPDEEGQREQRMKEMRKALKRGARVSGWVWFNSSIRENPYHIYSRIAWRGSRSTFCHESKIASTASPAPQNTPPRNRCHRMRCQNLFLPQGIFNSRSCMMKLINDTRWNGIDLWIVNVEPWNEKSDSCWICEGTVIFWWSVIHWYVIVTILGHRVMTMSDWEEPSKSSSFFKFLIFGAFTLHHISKRVSEKESRHVLQPLGFSSRNMWAVHVIFLDRSKATALVCLFDSYRQFTSDLRGIGFILLVPRAEWFDTMVG